MYAYDNGFASKKLVIFHPPLFSQTMANRNLGCPPTFNFLGGVSFDILFIPRTKHILLAALFILYKHIIHAHWEKTKRNSFSMTNHDQFTASSQMENYLECGEMPNMDRYGRHNYGNELVRMDLDAQVLYHA